MRLSVCLACLAGLLAVGAPAEAKPRLLRVLYDEGRSAHAGEAQRAGQLRITASSTLCEKSGPCHRPGLLIDGKAETAWCEGAPGKGVGQSVVFELQRARQLTAITFLPFYAKTQRTFFDNSRVKELELRTDEGSFRVLFSAEDPVSSEGRLHHSHPYVDFLTDPTVRRPITTRRVEIVVKAVYPGARFEDLCMSEVALYAR